jgi:hypothetical protein
VVPSSNPTAVGGEEDDEPDQNAASATKVPVKRAPFTAAMREVFGQLMDNLQEINAFVIRLE